MGTVDSDWAKAGNWRLGNVPGTVGTNFGCLYITNNTGNALYYTAAQGDTYLANTNTTTGSGRVLRVGGDSSATDALYITGGVLETRGAAGDLIGNTANSFGMVVVDGGKWVSSTNQPMLFGNSGARAVITVNSGTAMVGVVQAVNAAVGVINLNNGLLQLTRIERTGSMALTVNLNGGTLKAQTDQPAWLPAVGVTYNLGGPVVFDTFGKNVGVVGGLTGPGSLTKTGDGTLVLGGANSYDGLTTINAGVVLVTNNTGLGSQAAGTVIGAAGAYIRLGNGVTVTGESLTLLGNGDNYGALQSGANSTSVWNGPVFLASNAGIAAPRIGTRSGGVLTIAGPIANGALGTHLYISAHATGGRVILSATNTYSGNTGIVRGTLQLGVDDTIPAGSVLTLNAGNIGSESSVFDMAGFSQTLAGLASSVSAAQPCLVTNSSGALSTLTLNQSSDTFYSGAIGGTIALVKNGGGSLTLSNVNSFAGGVALNGGTLVAIASTGLGVGGVTVTGGALVLGTTNAVAGALTFAPAGNTAALGAAFPLDQAFLDWAAAKVVGTVPVIVVGTNNANNLVFGGALAASFLGAAGGTMTNSGAAAWGDTTLRLGGGPGTLVYTAAIRGNTNVVIGPAGGATNSTVVLPTGNTYTGPTTVNSGSLHIFGDSSLGAAPGTPTPGHLTLNGGRLYSAIAADISLSANRGIAIGTNQAWLGAANILRIPGVIADLPGEAGVLNIFGSGIVVLTGNNTYSGGTVIPSGARLIISGNRAMGDGPVILSGGLLRAAATAPAVNYVSNAVQIEANSAIGESNAKNLTFLGPITLVGGTPTLTMNGTDSAVFAGPVGDGGLGYGLTKAGTSTLTLSGTNTYTGPTRVAGGTLALPGAGTISNSATIRIDAGATLNVTARTGGSMSLVAGQTLMGGGTFTGGLIAEAGSTLSPGLSPGALSINGALVMNSGSTFSVELNGTTPGALYDQINMNGNALTLLSPNLAVTLGFTPAIDNRFHIVTGLSGFDPMFFGTFAGKPDGSTFTVGSTELRIDYGSSDITLTVVPEPGTLAALGLAASLGVLLRRRIR